jgi:hypothetical protein
MESYEPIYAALVATKAIRKGEEILTDYGDDYVFDVRHTTTRDPPKQAKEQKVVVNAQNRRKDKPPSKPPGKLVGKSVKKSRIMSEIMPHNNLGNIERKKPHNNLGRRNELRGMR